jgi:hypothetical protein
MELKVTIQDYGSHPNTTEDMVPIVEKALAYIKDQIKHGYSSAILEFSPGFYHFYPEHAQRRTYYMSNTDVVNPRRCGILIEHMHNLTIQGNGANFIYHDRMSAIVIDQSQDITINNLTIDWDRILGSECQVLAVTKTFIDLEIDEQKFPFQIKWRRLRFIAEPTIDTLRGVMEYDPETRTIPLGTGDSTLGWNWRLYRAKKIGKNRIRFFIKSLKPPHVGDYLVLRHHQRDHAGIFNTQSQNVILSHIDMYANAGLGVLSQYTENITLDTVRCVPNLEKRKFVSGHDDGFHFSNCKGQIVIDACKFEGLMDDPINVHGTSVKVIKLLSPTQVRARFMHNQSIGMPWGSPGDMVGIIDSASLATIQTVHITAIHFITPKEFEVEFDSPLSPLSIEANQKYALENLTWTPALTIRNSEFLSCRARGILITTPGKVIVEKNLFKSSGTAILIAGDANGWYESGAVTDVLIRDNTFTEFCLANLYQFCEGIISIYPEIPKIDPLRPFHKNIRIEDNHFHPFDYPVLYASSTDTISFSRNVIERSTRFEPYHSRKATLSFRACKNVVVEGNTIGKDVLGKNIWVSEMAPEELHLSKDEPLSVEVKN